MATKSERESDSDVTSQSQGKTWWYIARAQAAATFLGQSLPANDHE